MAEVNEHLIDLLEHSYSCQYRGTSWHWLLSGEWYDLCCRQSGCYAYGNGQGWLYIGQSVNLQNRIVQHFRERRAFSYEANELFIFIAPFTGGRFEYSLDAAERILIELWQPKYNKKPGRGHPVWRQDVVKQATRWIATQRTLDFDSFRNHYKHTAYAPSLYHLAIKPLRDRGLVAWNKERHAWVWTEGR